MFYTPFQKYMGGSFLYASVRTLFYTCGQKTFDYDKDFKKIPRPMLFMEKLGLGVANGLVGAWSLPIIMYYDAILIEKKLKGIPITPEDKVVLFHFPYKERS
jgi:hypothetical protein